MKLLGLPFTLLTPSYSTKILKRNRKCSFSQYSSTIECSVEVFFSHVFGEAGLWWRSRRRC